MSPIPVERLTSSRDTFRCDRFAAVIPARCCLSRQALVSRALEYATEPFVGCRGCAVGAAVKQAVAP